MVGRILFRLVLVVGLTGLGPAAWADGPRIIRNITYGGPAASPEEIGDLYLPAARRDTAYSPAVLIIHGGGWRIGSKRDGKVHSTAAFLQAHGYVAFAIDYHLSPTTAWPQNLFDCQIAVRWLRGNAAAYSVDPNRIAALGFSSGGHLATMLGVVNLRAHLTPAAPYSGVSTAIAAVVNFYGQPKVSRSNPEFGPLARQASPLFYVRPDLPPIMFVVGTNDKMWLVNEGRQFMTALASAGVPHRMLVVAGAAHGFNPVAAQTDVSGELLEFLDEHLASASRIIPGK